MRTSRLLAVFVVSTALAACPPTRDPQGLSEPSCENPAHTVSVWTNDTGMGVQVCVWVDNGTSEDLHISEWQEWNVNLCGGQPVDVVMPDELTSGLVVPAGESREVLGWNTTCSREDATTSDGAPGEPALVFGVSSDPDDQTCWTEAQSPRLEGFYCEG